MAVVANFFEGDRQGVRQALHDHAERIADQQHVCAALIEQPRERGVVGREHRDLALALAGKDHRHRDFVAGIHVLDPFRG
jgi:hypothetical protein